MDPELMLQIANQEAIDESVDIQYNDYIDEFMAGYEQLQYAAQSYDNDAICYGEQQ